MAVNYNDERFQKVNQEKSVALNNVNNLYNNMVNNSDNYYQSQIDAVNKYGDTQKQLQQEQTDFAIEKIEQQKEQTKQDYIKEQKGAYSDYQKQSNQYGVLAENMANQGMSNTGYAETSLRDVYNTYQNRVATARESYNRAVLNYDNGIKDAQLSNNSLLAEISYNTLKESLQLSLQGFQYKNDLLKEQLQMINNTEDRYYSRWKDVLDQINTENELEEQKRQFDQQMALQRASLYSKNGGGYNVDISDSGASNDKVEVFGLEGKFTGDYMTIYDKNGNIVDKTKIYVTDDGKMNQRWYWDGSVGTWKLYKGSTGGANVDTSKKISSKTKTSTSTSKTKNTKAFPKKTF